MEQLEVNEDAYKKIPGSYQLGSRIVERLIRRVLTTSGKKTALNTSSYAIDLMIYFSTVADDNCVVRDFSYTEVSEFSDMSQRNFYYCIQTLKNFGFISYESTGHGTMDITIINNDIKSNKKYGYINTNRTFFMKGTEEFSTYQQLSVYAKKTLLLLMLKYDTRYGLRIRLETIAGYLGIKNPALVISYLDELTDLLGMGYYSIEDSSNPKVVVKTNVYGLITYGDYKEQETFLKRAIRKTIVSYDIIYYDFRQRTINTKPFKTYMISAISGMFIKYVSLGVPFEKLFTRFIDSLQSRSHLSEGFIYFLNIEFKELYNRKSLT